MDYSKKKTLCLSMITLLLAIATGFAIYFTPKNHAITTACLCPIVSGIGMYFVLEVYPDEK